MPEHEAAPAMMRPLPADAPSRKAPARAKPHVQAKLTALRQELAALPIVSNVPAQAPKLTQQLASQVAMLHGAMLNLSDTVLEQISGLRGEVSRWRADRDEWLHSMRTMRQEVNDKLLQVEQEQARALVEVQGAKSALQASVGRSMEQLEQRAKALDKQMADTRLDVQMLRNQVVDMQVLTSDDFPAAVVKQRLLDRTAMQAQVDEVVRDVAPSAIRETVQREVPVAVREQVLTVMKEVVESRVQPLQGQVAVQVAAAVEGVEKLSMEVAQAGGELRSLQERCKANEAASSSLQPRLAALELEEQRCPRAFAQGLNERLEVATAQQARYARSMEEVVRALVDDASQLARQSQAHDVALQQHRQHLNETRDAVLRCSTTFSQVLNIPSPLPLRALASPLSPLPTSLGLPEQSAGAASATAASRPGTGDRGLRQPPGPAGPSPVFGSSGLYEAGLGGAAQGGPGFGAWAGTGAGVDAVLREADGWPSAASGAGRGAMASAGPPPSTQRGRQADEGLPPRDWPLGTWGASRGAGGGVGAEAAQLLTDNQDREDDEEWEAVQQAGEAELRRLLESMRGLG